MAGLAVWQSCLDEELAEKNYDLSELAVRLDGRSGYCSEVAVLRRNGVRESSYASDPDTSISCGCVSDCYSDVLS